MTGPKGFLRPDLHALGDADDKGGFVELPVFRQSGVVVPLIIRTE